MARKIEDIQGEYQQGCIKAGHIQYQIFCLQDDLDLLNSTFRDLNLEAATVKAAQEAAPQEPTGV